MPTPLINLQTQIKRGEKSSLFTILSPEVGSYATRLSTVLSDPTGGGIILIVKLANKAGTVGFTPRIHIQDEDGNLIQYWSAAAALTANGTYTYIICPGGSAGYSTGVTSASDLPLPREYVFQLYLSTGAGDGNEFDTEVYGYLL